jgi:hypothetical protein
VSRLCGQGLRRMSGYCVSWLWLQSVPLRRMRWRLWLRRLWLRLLSVMGRLPLVLSWGTVRSDDR